MTAPEPTPLEAAGFAWWSVHMHVGTWVDESPEMRAYYAEQAAKIVAPALAGDWLERVLGEHEWVGMLDECACGWDEGFRPKKRHPAHQAAAIRAAAGVGL